jgi:hypothetical protein
VPMTPNVLSLRINTLNWILAASSEGRTWLVGREGWRIRGRKWGNGTI